MHPSLRSYRRIRTTAERRASQKVKYPDAEDNQLYYRNARNYKNLPNSWDDIPISKRQKSWKAKRKTQYRSKPREYHFQEFEWLKPRYWYGWFPNTLYHNFCMDLMYRGILYTEELKDGIVTIYWWE